MSNELNHSMNIGSKDQLIGKFTTQKHIEDLKAPEPEGWDWQETGIMFSLEGGDDEEDDFDEGESIVAPIAGKTKTNEE